MNTKKVAGIFVRQDLRGEPEAARREQAAVGHMGRCGVRTATRAGSDLCAESEMA